jgi:hypothetical protein
MKKGPKKDHFTNISNDLLKIVNQFVFEKKL